MLVMGYLTILGTLSESAEVQSQPPAASLRVAVDSSAEMILGEPLDVRVTFANTGSEPFVFYRGIALGTAGELEISALGNGCELAVPETYIEAPPSWSPFFFVPLVPQRIIEESLRLNDVKGPFIQLPIHLPGSYDLSAHLTGTRTDPRYLRLWKGTAKSSPRRVTVRPARQESLTLWRNALHRCIEGDCQQLEAATNFFSLVRDEEGANLLGRLLARKPAVGYALAAQGRKSDVPALRSYAAAQTVPATREYFTKVLAKIDRGDPCR